MNVPKISDNTSFEELPEEQQNLLRWYARCGYTIQWFSNASGWTDDDCVNFKLYSELKYRIKPDALEEAKNTRNSSLPGVHHHPDDLGR
jgi:hypothetical protein